MLKHNTGKKRGLLQRFFNGFNRGYNATERGYAKFIGLIAGRRMITLICLVFFFIATWGISAILPSGFIPTEDQGMIYVNVTTPPGATLERTEEVLDQVQEIAAQFGGSGIHFHPGGLQPRE